MRFRIFRLIVTAAFLSIALALGYTQVMRGQYFYELSRSNRIRVVPVEGKRGRILDRNGVILADNRVSFDVTVLPQEVKNMDLLFGYLSGVLNIKKEKLIKTFERGRLAPFEPVVIAKYVKLEQAIVLEENKFRFPGLTVQVSTQRFYPYGALDAHVLGYVGKINRSRLTRLKEYGYLMQNIIGYSGVEEYYDTYLRGDNGGVQVEVNNRGEQVRLLGYRDPLMGQDLTLTIDHRLQEISLASLENKKGAVVIMDLDSGEILSMVSSPSFDPNDFVEEKNDMVGAYFNDSNAPLLNRVISGQYPPGSVFKLMLAVAGLEVNKVFPNTTFTCPGYYKLGKRFFRCSHTHGAQNLTEGIGHSCNVYFFNVGLLLGGPDIIAEYARQFGYGRLMNIDLPYEASGLLQDRAQRKSASRRAWYDGDTLNFSIGQGDTMATPLQLVCMMARLAKNGEEVDPHVLKAIGTSERQNLSLPKKIFAKDKTFEIVQAGMRAAVGDYSGTAHVLDFKDIIISGKTGTAQSSGTKPEHAWFVGYTFSTKPRIAFCVFLEYGGSSYHACQTARQIFLKIKEQHIL